MRRGEFVEPRCKTLRRMREHRLRELRLMQSFGAVMLTATPFPSTGAGASSADDVQQFGLYQPADPKKGH